MTTDRLRTAADARHTTRQNRERRTDAVLELPFNERVAVVCPVCGESFETCILTSDPAGYSPTFGRCSTWDCEAFLKFRYDGSGASVDQPVEEQTALEQFAGGRSR